MRSPAVGPWRVACSAREYRSGTPAEPPSLRSGRGPPRASRPAPTAGSRRRAGRAGIRRPPRGRTSRCSFERQNGKCEDTRIGCSPRFVTVRWIRSRPAASSTSPSANRIAPGPSDPAGPNGSRITNSRVPSSSRTSTRISCTIAATPSITWSGVTASRPAATTSSNEPPPRPAACISSHTSATASGAFSRRPFASVERARAGRRVKTRRRSSSVGVSCIGSPVVLLWRRRAYPRSRWHALGRVRRQHHGADGPPRSARRPASGSGSDS